MLLRLKLLILNIEQLHGMCSHYDSQQFHYLIYVILMIILNN